MQTRNTAQAATPENVDPTTFIQTLPPELRQSVLSDMDESLVAMLSEELAAEALTLRSDAERRYYQVRMPYIFRFLQGLVHDGTETVGIGN